METIESIIARVVREEIQALNPKSVRLLDAEQAADYLNTSDKGLDNLVSDGKLLPVRFDRKRRFDIVDLDKLIEESKRTGIALR